MPFAAVAASELGRVDDAVEYSSAFRSVFRDREWWVQSDIAGWADGVVAALQGETATALAEQSVALELETRKRSALFGRPIALDLAECALEAGDEARVMAAAASFDALGPADVPALRCFDEAVQAVALAVDGDRRRAVSLLDQTAAGFAASGWRLLATRATVLAGRIGARDDRAAAIARLEAAAEQLGVLGAVARRDRVVEVLEGLGRAGRRARTAVVGPESLTRREREVARLAAEGLSAKDIGARLFIGDRTVETHLANAYTKLGVRSRVELARRADELDL